MKEHSDHSDTQPMAVLWLTGLPGSGKTTIATSLRDVLLARNQRAVVLDGDTLRAGICADLGFSDEDRAETSRRVAHVAKMFLDQQYVVIVACISPLAAHRALARSLVGDRFIEVFVSTPLEVCVKRDPKGMYALAKDGRLPCFTGISAPYEPPLHAELEIDTSRCTVKEAMAAVISRLDMPPPGGQPLRAAAMGAWGSGVPQASCTVLPSSA